MKDEQWLMFFSICARVLGSGGRRPTEHGSWCAWTTFGSLLDDVHYWSAGLPKESELGPIGVADGGTWGQPFNYQDLAHVIVPRQVYWETSTPAFKHGCRHQDIQRLSAELGAAKVQHRLTDLVLEVKLY